MKRLTILALGLLTAGVGVAEVPDSFVEYIESTNSGSYVNTGIAPNPRKTRMVVKLAPMVVNNTQVAFFGSGDSWGNAKSNFILLNSSMFRLDWIGAQTKIFTPNVEQVYLFDCCNNIVSVDGQKWGNAATKTDADYPERPILLFNASNPTGKIGGAMMRLYDCLIFQDGVTMDVNYIPCVKDGVAGLYNAVDKTILYDAGNKGFVASAVERTDYRVYNGETQTMLTLKKPDTGGTCDEPETRWATMNGAVTLKATPDAGMSVAWTVVDMNGVSKGYYGAEVAITMPTGPSSVSLVFYPEDSLTTVDALETALKGAQEGDTIRLAPGTFELTKTLEIATGFTLQGAGRDETILTAAKIYDERVAYLSHAKATLKDLTVTGANAQLNGAGVYMVNGVLDNVRVYNNYQRGNGDNYNKGAGVYMVTGVITNSLVDYNFLKAGYHGSSGLGIYMKGGLVVDSEICHNWMDRNQHNGIGIWANAGAIRRCRIYDNYSIKNTSIGGSGAINMASGHGAFLSDSAVLEDSLVYSNGWNGVMMTGAKSIIRNCLIFGHRQGTADYFAGVNMSNGLLVNCTITDNCASGDTTGKSGLWQTGGTAINNIIVGNGMAAIGSCCVTGGTFDHNVTDVAVAGGTVADPKFADAANGDYHLTGASTVAIDKGLERVDVPHDLDGIARPQKNGWDIGCYEYVPDTKPTVAISIDRSDYPDGETLAATAVTENIDETAATFTWKLTGAVTYTFEGVGEDYKTFVYPEAAVGAYELSLVVTAGGASVPAVGTETFSVKPTTVYLSKTGSATAPYDTPDKATDSLSDAIAAIWQAKDVTTTVHVAAGTYELTETMIIANPIQVLGEGRDATVFTGTGLSGTRGFNLNAAGTLLKDLTVTGCKAMIDGTAILMGAGVTLDNVRVTGNVRQRQDGVGSIAAGVWMTGGTMTNCLIDANSAQAAYDGTKGIGVYMTDGLLVDSVVCSNRFDRNQHSGVGVCAEGGTVRRCRIFDNMSSVNTQDTRAHGIYVSGSDTLVEDCLVYSNGWCGVQLTGGTMRNSAIYGHKANDSADFWAGAYVTGGKLQNCTLYDNVAGGDSTGKSGLYQTGGTVENCIVWASAASAALGSCQVTKGTFRNNITDKAIATGTGCVYADPQFVNAAACDFHLSKSSPAIDAGCEIAPFETDAGGNPVDIEGVVRPQKDAWDIGAYEYVAGTEPSASIVAQKVDFPRGARLEARTKTENIDDGSATFAWTLRDQAGASVAELSGTGVDYMSFEYDAQATGILTLSLVVTVGETAIEAENVVAFSVKPTEVFVATTGSHEFPFNSWATAATNMNEAVASMWTSADSTGVVHIAAGEYRLTDAITFNTPMRVLGAGRDATVFHVDYDKRGFLLTQKDVIVSDLTLTGVTNSFTGVGSAIRMEDGLLRNVRVTKTYIQKLSGSQNTTAAALLLSGGTVTNCLFDANGCGSDYGITKGLGVYMTGGLLVDSVVCSNWVARNQLSGIGVFASGGTVRRCDIFRNTGMAAEDSYGMNLAAEPEKARDALLIEDTRIHDSLNGVCLKGKTETTSLDITLRNCLICDHHYTLGTSAGLIADENVRIVNCTIAGNTCTDETKGDATFASGTRVTNTIAVAAAVNGDKGEHNCFNTPVAFKRGYRLKGKDNPCVNAGDNSVWEGFADPKDLDGKTRICEKIVDLGCFEHEPSGLSVLIR